MRKSKLITPFVMLLAGFVTSVAMYLKHYDLTSMLKILLVVLIVFYFVGDTFRFIYEKFRTVDVSEQEEDEGIDKEIIADEGVEEEYHADGNSEMEEDGMDADMTEDQEIEETDAFGQESHDEETTEGSDSETEEYEESYEEEYMEPDDTVQNE